MKNNNSKINNGCLNIFKLLVLLYNDDADYDKVVNIFKNDIDEEEHIDEKKLNNLIQVVLNKYINALKVFGVKIHKNKNKYILDSSFYSIDYSLQDLKALSIILGASDQIQDAKISKNISKFKTNLLLRMSSQNKNKLDILYSENNFSFFYTDFNEQIDKCRKYVQDGMLLNMVYLVRGKERRCKCQAKEVLYDVKTAYLKVYEISKNEYIEIALPNILSIEILPNITMNYSVAKTVVFKLKGRLAKTYKLKPNEKLSKKENDELIIVNKNEPIDKLLSRLMRYSDLCEIMTPKYLRQDMVNLIDETINLYNN